MVHAEKTACYMFALGSYIFSRMAQARSTMARNKSETDLQDLIHDAPHSRQEAKDCVGHPEPRHSHPATAKAAAATSDTIRRSKSDSGLVEASDAGGDHFRFARSDGTSGLRRLAAARPEPLQVHF